MQVDVHLPGCSKRVLVRLAALVWLAGVVVLLFKSTGMFTEAFKTGAPVPLVAAAVLTGLVLGLIKAKYLFIRTCKKNIQRISSLNSPKIWQFYRIRFFFFLFLMITFGNWAYGMARHDTLLLLALALLELSISVALLISAGCFKKSV